MQMIQNSKFKRTLRGIRPQALNQNSSAGITLIEIVVVIFIITIFSLILFADFPKIQRQYALSSSTYKLAQNFRKVQDLGLSGVQLKDINGDEIAVKGYGIYVKPSENLYIIYADIAGAPDQDGVRTSDRKYSGDTNYHLCSDVNQGGDPLPNLLTTDCVIEKVYIKLQNTSLYIKRIYNIADASEISNPLSINFTPPNPTVDIIDDLDIHYYNTAIGIVFGLTTDNLAERTVKANTSGLIDIK